MEPTKKFGIKGTFEALKNNTFLNPVCFNFFSKVWVVKNLMCGSLCSGTKNSPFPIKNFILFLIDKTFGQERINFPFGIID